MKLMVCDMCRKDGKLVETRKYFRLPKTGCRIDVCPEHSPIVKRLPAVQFVQLSYEFSGVPISEENAYMILKGRV